MKFFDPHVHMTSRTTDDYQALADAGVVHARRGAGVFVATTPTEYALGRRVRFHQNVLANGRTPSRRMLRTETRPAAAA